MSDAPNPSPRVVSNPEIAEFYDDFSERLLRGYVTGNPRIEHLLRFAIDQIPANAKSLLEVGCGVGETTHRLCLEHPALRAVGVDISAENVRLARQVFGSSTPATFAVSDLSQPVEGGPFDVVTLLDVYEHIPSGQRKGFHQNLRQSMSDQSRLIVTCPSFLHQHHLREHEPEGLQIVDETIDIPELLQLAEDLGGHLTHVHYETVWRTNDYIYATIDTAMPYQWKPKARGWARWTGKIAKALGRTPLGGPARRKRFVQRRLAA